MSSLTGLYGGGGGGTPVNSIAQLFVGGQTQYTDADGGVWLKTGSTIVADDTTYPDAYITPTPITGGSYVQSFSVSSQTSQPYGVELNNDGSKMYVAGIDGDSVYEYSLSTSFDISTSSYTTSFSVSAQDGVPTDIAFNNDGSKMYVMGNSTDSVYEYSLSTPFDVSTSSYTTSFSVSTQDAFPQGLTFNNDGSKMYIVGSSSDAVYEYNLSTSFDISTASYDSSFSVSSQDTAPVGVRFNSDGTKMYVLGDAGRDVNEYSLSTAFDISTASFTNNTFLVGNQDSSPRGFTWSSDYTKLYIMGDSNNAVFQYSFDDKMGLSTNTGTYDYIKLK